MTNKKKKEADLIQHPHGEDNNDDAVVTEKEQEQEQDVITLEDTIIGSMETSIKLTKSCLMQSIDKIQSGGGGDNFPLVEGMISDKLLSRPPFPFIHALVKLFVEKIDFANGLYNNNNNSDYDGELNNISSLSRQDKMRFLVKIIAYVASITNIRVDIYVSPAKILSGQDVQSTHLFLRCLAIAASSSASSSSSSLLSSCREKVNEILQIGETALYKQSVQTRNTVIRIQAIFRGKRVKEQMLSEITRREKKGEKESVHDKDKKKESKNGQEVQTKKLAQNTPDAFQKEVVKNVEVRTKPHGRNATSQLVVVDEDNDQTYHPVTNSLDAVETKVDALPNEIPSRNTNCVPLNNIKSKDIAHIASKIREVGTQTEKIGKKRIQRMEKGTDDGTIRDGKNVAVDKRSLKERKMNVDTQSSNPSSLPKSKVLQKEATTTTPKKKIKYKIVNGIMTREQLSVDEAESEQMSNEVSTEEKIAEEVKELQTKLKKHLMKVQDRESKLKKRFEEVKLKEEQLVHHEARVCRIAENLRKQQNKLKEDGIKQVMEMDKMRLQLTEAGKGNNIQQDVLCEDDESQQYSELLKQSSGNPTITDLRLKLERKERALNKRGQKMKRMEKELVQQRDKFLKASGEKSTDHYQTDPHRFQSSMRTNHTSRLKHEKRNKSSTKSSRDLESGDEENHGSSINAEVPDHRGSNNRGNTGESKKRKVVTAKTGHLSPVERQSERGMAPSPKKQVPKLQKRRSDKSLQHAANTHEEFPRRLLSYSTHYKQLEKQQYLIHPSQKI